ncbi:MAG: nucleotidyltransferase family protein [Parachlamydia sp.]|nr:nucleotidyltransferase family protein [Parachlamydia sp.]
MNDINKIIPVKAIVNFCKAQKIISKLSLFGSIVKDKLGPESDVDFLVEFDSGKTPSLLNLVGMEDELSEIIGRKADLRTPNELSHFFRNEVIEQAKPLYVKP